MRKIAAAIKVLLVGVGLLTIALFSVIGFADVFMPARSSSAAVGQPSVEWRQEELRQAAAIRYYTSITVTATDCGRRTEDWSQKLLASIKAVIPPDRTDLLDEMERGKIAGGAPLEDEAVIQPFCSVMERTFKNADQVISGERDIFAPVEQ